MKARRFIGFRKLSTSIAFLFTLGLLNLLMLGTIGSIINYSAITSRDQSTLIAIAMMIGVPLVLAVLFSLVDAFPKEED